VSLSIGEAQIDNASFFLYSKRKLTLLNLRFILGRPIHRSPISFLWLLGFHQTNNLIFKDRDGQREMLQFTASVKGTLMGAGAFFNKPANSLDEQVYNNELDLFVR
jgi:hypothetical protein